MFLNKGEKCWLNKSSGFGVSQIPKYFRAFSSHLKRHILWAVFSCSPGIVIFKASYLL